MHHFIVIYPKITKDVLLWWEEKILFTAVGEKGFEMDLSNFVVLIDTIHVYRGGRVDN